MKKIKGIFSEKGLLSGKRVLAATITMVMLSGMTMYAAAEAHTWVSKGDVKYQDASGNQTTLFAKEDLDYINGRIDDLKTNTENGKAEVASAINSYGYHKDSNVDSTASYSDLASAIKTSQQIPTDRTFSGTKPGETDETSGAISAATADNLSLGTAAWVDGELIVGTGADNNSYYDSSMISDYSQSLYCEIEAGGATRPVYCYISIKSGVLSVSWSNNGYVGGQDSGTVYFRTTPLTYNLYK